MSDNPTARVHPAGPVARTSEPPGRPRRRMLRTLALGLFALLALGGAITAAAAVGGFILLSRQLPDPRSLETMAFTADSAIFDRTGTHELARFGTTNRQVVTYDQIPPILIDATTAVEDKTFWTNSGFDPVAIVSAAIDTLRGSGRGASTITQQLVRQRLLDPAVVQRPGRVLERKAEELVQSIRLTEAFPGVEGKQRIITAYLNQDYYGNNDYGVMAAARDYFGITDLRKLTLAQAAIIAAIPQSPVEYDLARNAVESSDGKLVVPPDRDIVQRRNLVLRLLADGRTPLTGDKYTAADFQQAMAEPVVLAPQRSERWTAPAFVWNVREEVTSRLCGTASTCPALERGGLRIVTSLDLRLQAAAERWVKAAAIVPNAKDPKAAAAAIGVSYAAWMQKLRGSRIGNGALVALDYQTGEIVAYVGSADYYAAATPLLQPKFDVLSNGWRQPGSAFKPLMYATGIDSGAITAGSVLMDVTTDFGGGYAPTDADGLERGPVRVREALEFSLNIPAVKAIQVIGQDAVFQRASALGLRFQGSQPTAGPSMALGTEVVHPLDVATAYATLANGGAYVGHTSVLRIMGPDGTDLVPAYQPPTPQQVVSAGAAAIVTDILAGNTDPRINPFWGRFQLTAGGTRRPATLKTGTNDQARDLNAYGFVGAPDARGRQAGEYALVAGVWNGNSDNSLITSANRPIFSSDVSTYVWQGFMTEAAKGWGVHDFAVPQGVVTASIDPWTGLLASSGGPAVRELFIDGTQPKQTVEAAGVCGADLLGRVGFESSHAGWLAADRDWLARAARGAGIVGGPKRTATAYFYDASFQPYGASWGAFLGPTCGASPSPTESASASPSESPSASPSESASPSPPESASPSPPPSPNPPPSSAPPPSVAPSPSPSPSPVTTTAPSPSVSPAAAPAAPSPSP